MEITFEALLEAVIRLPKQVGAAVSIVGALVSFCKNFCILLCSGIRNSPILNLSDYRPIIWPIGILLIEFSWAMPNMMYFNNHSNTYFPLYAAAIQTILPILLLKIAYVRKKHKGSQ